MGNDVLDWMWRAVGSLTSLVGAGAITVQYTSSNDASRLWQAFGIGAGLTVVVWTWWYVTRTEQKGRTPERIDQTNNSVAAQSSGDGLAIANMGAGTVNVFKAPKQSKGVRRTPEPSDSSVLPAPPELWADIMAIGLPKTLAEMDQGLPIRVGWTRTHVVPVYEGTERFVYYLASELQVTNRSDVAMNLSFALKLVVPKNKLETQFQIPDEGHASHKDAQAHFDLGLLPGWPQQFVRYKNDNIKIFGKVVILKPKKTLIGAVAFSLTPQWTSLIGFSKPSQVGLVVRDLVSDRHAIIEWGGEYNGKLE